MTFLSLFRKAVSNKYSFFTFEFSYDSHHCCFVGCVCANINIFVASNNTKINLVIASVKIISFRWKLQHWGSSCPCLKKQVSRGLYILLL